MKTQIAATLVSVRTRAPSCARVGSWVGPLVPRILPGVLVYDARVRVVVAAGACRVERIVPWRPSQVLSVRRREQARWPDLAATSAESGEHEPLDVLVVGGGIVGTGAALDAVSRGLSVGLLEQRDLASGTSSRSSKLVHGGLRYLEMFDFGLVREALEERGLLLTRLAPHLVRPVPFLYPLYRTDRAAVRRRRPRVVRRAGHGRQVRDGRARATGTCSASRSRGSRPTSAPTGSPAPCATTTARSTTPVSS